jgi:TRAP-type mannitol/chloroaromatic compound transport system permease small subunit
MVHVPFSWRVGEKAVESVIRAPLYPLKTIIPVVCVMLLFQGSAEFIRSLFVVVTRKELQWK